ncbi:MAG: hypothetical protein FJ148_16600 [Deltaproteobacteria bacterium]|nr:hypothetical protein [Deltaproteobacteria bacterium]
MQRAVGPLPRGARGGRRLRGRRRRPRRARRGHGRRWQPRRGAASRPRRAAGRFRARGRGPGTAWPPPPHDRASRARPRLRRRNRAARRRHPAPRAERASAARAARPRAPRRRANRGAEPRQRPAAVRDRRAAPRVHGPQPLARPRRGGDVLGRHRVAHRRASAAHQRDALPTGLARRTRRDLGPRRGERAHRLERRHHAPHRPPAGDRRPQDRERVAVGLRAALAGPASHWQDEYPFRCFDGRWADVIDRGFIVRDEAGRALRVVGAIEDVSERRRAEAERAALLARERRARADAEAANRAKDEFLAVVSHELRTPLSPILGFLEILLEDPGATLEQRAALGTIERNARSLSYLIDDLLDVWRITSGKLSLEHAPIDLGEVVRAVFESARPAAETKGVTLALQVLDEPLVVAGDAGRLTQVVANLVSNAIKFTPLGGAIRVELTRVRSRAVLRVQDTGKGIAAELLPHVFERFRQGDTSDTRVHGGLGLGLAIVRHLVDLHGGSVTAESGGEGRGPVLTVELPLSSRRAS